MTVRSLRGRCAALFTVLVALGAAGSAHADERTEARRHFRRGMELVVQGQIDAGVAEFEEAYNILPHPNVLYNIGRAYAEAGRYDEAMDYFERYLSSGPPDADEVLGLVNALRERMAARDAIRAAAANASQQAEPTQPVTTSTQPTQTSTDVVVAGGAEEAAHLRETADRLETLSQALGSADLMSRATALRALATAIEQAAARGGAGQTAQTTPTDTTPTGTQPSDGTATEQPTENALELGQRQPQDLYEERFVSSTRSAVDPLDAPNSTTIITRQDIRLTGLTNVGELLRRVAGVQVMTTSPSETNVGIRGFNGRLSPRVLVLVNGRSTYIDPLGISLYAQLQFGTEDIERIEVVRGPASALYGANGFSGIVNIITREAGVDPGTEVHVGAGNGGQMRAYLGTSGRTGNLGYRFSANYNAADRFTIPYDTNRIDVHQPAGVNPNVALRDASAFGNITYRINPRTQVYAEGGTTFMDQAVIAATGVFNDIYTGGNLSYAMTGISSGWGGIRFFWNNFDITGDQFAARPFPLRATWNTYDVEGTFSHEFRTGPLRHNVVAGAGYRRKSVDWNIFRQGFTEDHFQVFLQDSIKLTDRVTLVAGARMDRHPLLQRPVFSPRAALVARVGDRQAIRGSFSTAFRTMSFIESYVYTRQPTPVTAVTAIGLGSDERRRFFNGPPLRPERILAGELGYQNSESDVFTFDVATYFNRVQNIINLSDKTDPFTLAQANDPALAAYDLNGFVPSSNAFVYGQAGFDNSPAIYYAGGLEVVGRLYPVDGLDIWANYTLNVTYRDDGGEFIRDRRAPTHQVNGGVQYRGNLTEAVGFDLGIDTHVQTSTVWREQVITGSAIEQQDFNLNSLYMINGRIGVRLHQDKLSLGIVGYNVNGLWQGGIRQHPYTQQINARVMGTASYRF